jgi:geranylgeranyl diphosphate synthase type II
MAGAPDKDTALLYQMGEAIGIGFQLKDDLLDVFGEQAKFGKQVGGDIIANKKTFLLIKALQMAGDGQQLQEWIRKKNFVAAEKVQAITAIYDQLGIRQIAEKKMNEYFALGLSCLDQIHADAGRKVALRKFVERIITRDN